MSITRLQQARQMYAMGQRVAKTMDGSRPGYGGGAVIGNQGTGGYQGGEKGGYGRSDDRGASKGFDRDYGGGADPITPTPVTETFPSNFPTDDKKTFTVSTNPMDLREQYRLGNVPTNVLNPKGPSFVTFDNPYVSLELEKQRKDNTIDALNLAGATYQGVNVPAYVPGGMIINTLGNFLGGLGFKRNTKFFADNVAGKYGYGYGLKDYQQYMKDRTSGKVGAYGNEAMGQNAINARGGDSSRENLEGIMSAYNNNQVPDYGDEDGDGDVDNDDFIFKYFDKTGQTLQAGAGGVQDLMTSIRERISNLFS